MPRFDFQCEHCGLLFEKLFQKSEVSDTAPCLKCSKDSQRLLPQVGFSFGSGKTVGNTGVDSLDSSIDKAVGRDADKRWESVKVRDHYKREVQRDNGGVKKVPLRKNAVTGEYEAMQDTDVERFQTFHKTYGKMYEEHKKEREAKGESKFGKDDPYVKYRQKKSSKS
jgi:putative FmdB family regulatory protein